MQLFECGIDLATLTQCLLVRLQNLGMMGLRQGFQLSIQISKLALDLRTAFQPPVKLAQPRSLGEIGTLRLFETTVEIANFRCFVDDVEKCLAALSRHGRDLALGEQPDGKPLCCHSLAGRGAPLAARVRLLDNHSSTVPMPTQTVHGPVSHQINANLCVVT